MINQNETRTPDTNEIPTEWKERFWGNEGSDYTQELNDLGSTIRRFKQSLNHIFLKHSHNLSSLKSEPSRFPAEFYDFKIKESGALEKDIARTISQCETLIEQKLHELFTRSQDEKKPKITLTETETSLLKVAITDALMLIKKYCNTQEANIKDVVEVIMSYGEKDSPSSPEAEINGVVYRVTEEFKKKLSLNLIKETLREMMKEGLTVLGPGLNVTVIEERPSSTEK